MALFTCRGRNRSGRSANRRAAITAYSRAGRATVWEYTESWRILGRLQDSFESSVDPASVGIRSVFVLAARRQYCHQCVGCEAMVGGIGTSSSGRLLRRRALVTGHL